MSERLCSFDGCARAGRGLHGLCRAHYEQRCRGSKLTPIKSGRGLAMLGHDASVRGGISRQRGGGAVAQASTIIDPEFDAEWA
jgi:hypothetical protein